MESVYLIWIKHESLGVECERRYIGSEIGAKRAANKSARAAGPGWEAVVVEDTRYRIDNSTDSVYKYDSERGAYMHAAKTYGRKLSTVIARIEACPSV